MKLRPSRRRFLQAAGLGAGGLFLPSLLRGKPASAGVATPPMRLVICYHQHGVPHVNWDMHQGMPANTRWEYGLGGLTEAEFSACLRPLHRHRNKLTVVDGLSLATAIADPYGDGHAKGWVSSLTGGIARETIEGVKSNAAKPSIDQVIKNALRAQDATLTDLASLEIGIYEYNFHAALFGELQAGQPVQRVPHEEQPQCAVRPPVPQRRRHRAARSDQGRAARRAGVGGRHVRRDVEPAVDRGQAQARAAPRPGARHGIAPPPPRRPQLRRAAVGQRLLLGRGPAPAALRRPHCQSFWDLTTRGAVVRHLARGHDAVGPAVASSSSAAPATCTTTTRTRRRRTRSTIRCTRTAVQRA